MCRIQNVETRATPKNSNTSFCASYSAETSRRLSNLRAWVALPQALLLEDASAVCVRGKLVIQSSPYVCLATLIYMAKWLQDVWHLELSNCTLTPQLRPSWLIKTQFEYLYGMWKRMLLHIPSSYNIIFIKITRNVNDQILQTTRKADIFIYIEIAFNA